MSCDFLKDVGTLYDLLINLLNTNETIIDSLTIQNDLTEIMLKLKKYITDKSEKQKKKEIFAAQSSVLTS